MFDEHLLCTRLSRQPDFLSNRHNNKEPQDMDPKPNHFSSQMSKWGEKKLWPTPPSWRFEAQENHFIFTWVVRIIYYIPTPVNSPSVAVLIIVI